MSAYLDASCLAMLTLEDVGWRVLRQWLEDTVTVPIYSDFGWGELVSAISLRVRSGALTRDGGVATLNIARGFTATWPLAPCASEDLAAAARYVADFDLKLRFPDAIHVAIVRRLGVTLVTADARQAIAARSIGVTVFNPLEEPR